MSLSSQPSSTAEGFAVKFGNPGNGVFLAGPVLALPLLGGAESETIFNGARPAGMSAGFELFRQGELLIGFRLEPVTADPETQTERFYRDLLTVTAGRELYRIWNYIPGINLWENGQEAYRAFCLGRSRAFEAVYGTDYARVLPSASAVGNGAGQLAVIFVAGAAPARHFENPEQLPAYAYPPEHGPRAPSFSRATGVTEDGRRFFFISGTAAIKGHATVAPGSLSGQIDCTRDNLRLISLAGGLGDDLGATAGGWRRHFKVYLRQASDYPAAHAALTGTLLRAHDRVTWLQADICRAALLIEIEATLVAEA